MLFRHGPRLSDTDRRCGVADGQDPLHDGVGGVGWPADSGLEFGCGCFARGPRLPLIPPGVENRQPNSSDFSAETATKIVGQQLALPDVVSQSGLPKMKS